MAQRISQVPGIAMVRGITRPTGELLEQAKATYQAGEVGRSWRRVRPDHGPLSDLDELAKARHHGRRAQRRPRPGSSAINSVRDLVDALGYMEACGGDKTLEQIDNAAQLVERACRSSAMRSCANLDKVTESFVWIRPGARALNSSPVCITDPACASARTSCSARSARQRGTFDKIADLARQLQSTQGAQPSVDDGTDPRRSRRPAARCALGARTSRAACKTAWPAAARAPTSSPTRASRSPTACSCWSTRPRRWVADSTRRRSFCWP